MPSLTEILEPPFVQRSLSIIDEQPDDTKLIDMVGRYLENAYRQRQSMPMVGLLDRDLRTAATLIPYEASLTLPIFGVLTKPAGHFVCGLHANDFQEVTRVVQFSERSGLRAICN